jgi:hypothetical protein
MSIAENTENRVQVGFICCICGDPCLGWGPHQRFGHNPYPVVQDEDAECCGDCNDCVVIPARIAQMPRTS